MADTNSRDSLERYTRQVRYAPLGEEGQRRLLASRALVCGCGALGSVIANTFGSSIVIKGPNINFYGPMECFPGTITVVGTVTTPSIFILIDPSGAGQFNASGNIFLNGTTLSIQLNNCVPPQGAQYSVVTYGASFGNFQSVQGLANGAVLFAPAMLSNSFVLTTTAGGPAVQTARAVRTAEQPVLRHSPAATFRARGFRGSMTPNPKPYN